MSLSIMNVTIKNFPTEPHYAIIVEEQRYVEDGYGSSTTEPYIVYKAFDTREEWETLIVLLSGGGVKFKAFFATPATVSTKVDIDIKL